MLPLILEAYRMVLAPAKYGGRNFPNAWEAGRPGKAASWLCATHPGEFEPQQGMDLRGDTEWFYSIDCINSKGGEMSEVPT